MNARSTIGIQRIPLPDGKTRLAAAGCEFLYQRLKPGVLLIKVTGSDRGQFGSATVDEVASELPRFGKPLAVFFDLRAASGPSTAVMELWTSWFAAHKNELRRVVLLVPPESKVLHLTVSIAQHLSHTGSLLRICGDPLEFERAIGDEVPNVTGSGRSDRPKLS